MKIKKIKPVKAGEAPTSAAAGDPAEAGSTSGASKGATIADRFKLDVPDASAKKGGSVSKTAATIALIVGFAALAVAGILTLVLYQHWDFLCNQVA